MLLVYGLVVTCLSLVSLWCADTQYLRHSASLISRLCHAENEQEYYYLHQYIKYWYNNRWPPKKVCHRSTIDRPHFWRPLTMAMATMNSPRPGPAWANQDSLVTAWMVRCFCSAALNMLDMSPSVVPPPVRMGEIDGNLPFSAFICSSSHYCHHRACTNYWIWWQWGDI